MWRQLDVYVSRDEYIKLRDIVYRYSLNPNDVAMAGDIADMLGLSLSDILYTTLNLIVKDDSAKSINEVGV